jgi:hypothetical protein
MNLSRSNLVARFASLLALCLITSQCAEKKVTNEASETSRPRTLTERLNSKEKQGYFKDSEGNWKSNSNKRSSFESAGQASMGKKDFNTKKFNPGNYEKKSWWGNREYKPQQYAGNTDASRFATTAPDAGKSAAEAGNSSFFSGKKVDANRITRQGAREESATGLSRPSDAETDLRRKVYQEPTIIDWREQRALQIKDTKSWLRK